MQKRNVVTVDVPNIFVQTNAPTKGKGKTIIIKVKGILVKVLCTISFELHARFVTYEYN